MKGQLQQFSFQYCEYYAQFSVLSLGVRILIVSWATSNVNVMADSACLLRTRLSTECILYARQSNKKWTAFFRPPPHLIRRGHSSAQSISCTHEPSIWHLINSRISHLAKAPTRLCQRSLSLQRAHKWLKPCELKMRIGSTVPSC